MPVVFYKEHTSMGHGVILLLCHHLPKIPRESGLGGKSLIDGIGS